MKADHHQILTEFRSYLKVKGYSETVHKARGVKELLEKMEQEGKSLTKLRRDDVEQYYQYLCNRPSLTREGSLSLHTITGYMYVLKLFFFYLEKVDLIEQNPMSGLRLKPVPKTQRLVLQKSQIEQLYKACKDEQERAILALFYGCGLRRMEAQKLNIRDVDFKNGWLYVRSGKGKKRRVIPMAQNVSTDLKTYLYNKRPTQITRYTKPADGKAFMLNQNGTRMRGGSYWIYFRRILNRSELNKKVSLHHLRHSIATHLLQSGMSIEEVRDFLGHDHLETTQVYTRISTHQLKL